MNLVQHLLLVSCRQGSFRHGTHHVAETDDGVEWCAQGMTHVGQEDYLQLFGLLRTSHFAMQTMRVDALLHM